MVGDSSKASRVKLAQFTYDFAVHGGTTGAIIVGAGRLPAGAIIFDGLIHVITAVVGTTSTLAISVMTANDLLTATAEATLIEDYLADVVPAGSAATAIIVTSEKGCTFTIGTADLTAGKVCVSLRYFETE
jgi:hypothetical protein